MKRPPLDWIVAPLFAALVAAAIDTVATRQGLPHRATAPDLLAQAWGLYAVFAFVAALPLWIVGRLRESEPRKPGEPRLGLGFEFALLFLIGAPVLLHSVLNDYTSIGGVVEGLKSPEPWLKGGGLVLVAGVLCWGVAKRLRRVRTQAARGLLGFAALTVGLLLPLGTGPAEPRSAAREGDDRPNLILLVWDTTRARSLSPFGYDRQTTPRLAELAETSRTYTNARSVTHFTFTSHLSMLTGRYPTRHGARLLDTRYLPERSGPTIAHDLGAAGYRTGGFVGTGVLRAGTGIADGFEVWDDQVDPPVTESFAWALIHDVQSLAISQGSPLWNDGRPHWIEDFQRPGAGVLERALEWIRTGDERPYFCLINLFDVHWPYTPNEESSGRWVRDYDGPMGGFVFRANDYPDDYYPTAADNRHLTELYDAEMWELDALVADFIEQLDLDASNTAVLITSDHGEAFGEAGRYEHEDILEPQVRVPFMLRLPGDAQAGERIATPVSGVDVAPTLLGLAGVEPTGAVDGQDLVERAPEPDRIVLVEDRDYHEADRVQLALYWRQWKLLRQGDYGDPHELYDLSSDDLGVVDVSAEHPELKAELYDQMNALRPLWPRDADGGGGVDELPSMNSDVLKGLGYMDAASPQAPGSSSTEKDDAAEN
jgi:arylsulfatase A-like enzyme